MIVIDSTQSTDDVAHLLKAQGYEPVTPEPAKPKEEAAPPKVETNSSEQTEKPGSESSAAPDSKIAAVTEPVETKPQEAQQEPTEVTEEATATATEAEVKKDKPKGGFKVKLEKKTAEIDKINRQLEMARDALEFERGDKTKLLARIDELQGKVDGLAKPATEAKAEELVKPKRPLLKDFDFDSDKYEVAMTAHEDAMSDYHSKVAKQEVDRQLKAAEEKRQQADIEVAAQRALADFSERKDKGKSLYEDFDDVIAALPADAVTLVDLDDGVTKGYIGETENPAHLMRYLAMDFLENDGAESARLAALNPYKRIKELMRIETELAAELAPPPKETPKASEVTPKESVVAPAKPAAIPKPTEAPLRTVGSRSGTAQPNMQELATKDPKAFMKAVMGGQEKRKTSAGG